MSSNFYCKTIKIALPVYINLDEVTRKNIIPPAGSYTPEEEQKRRDDLTQGARDVGNTLVSAQKGFGQVAGICLVLWSLIASLRQDAFHDDEDKADWSKILGSGISVASGVMAGVEGFHQIRAASLGLAPDTTVIGGLRWTVAGNVLGAAAGLVSVLDGAKKLTEAAEAARTGSSLSARSSMIVGGVGVVAGIASIVVIAASGGIGLIASLFMGILTLMVGYWFVTLVSPAVQMWVNRSIFRKQAAQEEMQVLPFEDMASEQGSLKMVFPGA